MLSLFPNKHFKYLLIKIIHYVPEVDGFDEDRVKSKLYNEIFEILEKNDCKNWDGILAFVIHNFDYKNSTKTLEIVRKLVEGGVSLEDVNINSKTPLEEAVSLYPPQPILVEYLLKKGAKPDSIYIFETFFETYKEHILLLKGAIKVAKILLRAGAPLPFSGKITCCVEMRIIVRELEKKLRYKTKCRELELQLEKAQEYIYELEYRPPELGGPEYEKGKDRWEMGRKEV